MSLFLTDPDAWRITGPEAGVQHWTGHPRLLPSLLACLHGHSRLLGWSFAGPDYVRVTFTSFRALGRIVVSGAQTWR